MSRKTYPMGLALAQASGGASRFGASPQLVRNYTCNAGEVEVSTDLFYQESLLFPFGNSL